MKHQRRQPYSTKDQATNLKEQRMQELDRAYVQHLRYLKRILGTIKRHALYRKEKKDAD